MSFCQKCGAQLAEGAKFCPSCGTASGASGATKVTVGEVRKCPQCGQVLGALDAKCPSCGHEITGVKAVSSVREFFDMYQNEKNEKKQLDLIKNYPIPNSKEDIIEFALLTAQQIKSISAQLTTKMNDPMSQMNNLYGKGGVFGMYKATFFGSKEDDTTVKPEDFFAAWKDKADQVNTKAELLFSNDPDTISKIQKILMDAVEANANYNKKVSGRKKKIWIIGIGVVVFLIVFYALLFAFVDLDGSEGSEQAEQTYEKVLNLMEEGKYDQAELLIPELRVPHYTKDKEIWAPRRETLQKQIDKKRGNK